MTHGEYKQEVERVKGGYFFKGFLLNNTGTEITRNGIFVMKSHACRYGDRIAYFVAEVLTDKRYQALTYSDLSIGDTVIVNNEEWEITALDGQNFVGKNNVGEYDAFNPGVVLVYDAKGVGNV